MTSHRILFIVAFSLAVFQFASVGLCQSGNVWGTTPVFDGGRVMPMTSFAKRIVTEICGESRPFIVRDDSILAELNRVVDAKIADRNDDQADTTKDADKKQKADNNQEYRFLIRGSDLLGNFDTGITGSTPAAPEQTPATILAIRNMTSSQADLISRRIRFLIPAEGRYFESDELLLSWMVEPEIWDFVPLFAAAESDYRIDVLDALAQNDAHAQLRRVAVFQLKQSDRFQQRLADVERKQMQRQFAEVPIRYDQITERIAAAMATFQELTFHPRKMRPTRMIGLLQQTVDFSARQSSSYSTSLESWGHLLELGEVPARQTLEPNTPGREDDEITTQLHPTTQRWHDIVKKIRLIAGAFDRIDRYGEMSPPNLNAVEKQFEILLRMIDVNFEESEALMETVYPGVVFRKTPEGGTDVLKLLPLLSSPENREKNKEIVARIVLTYHYSIKSLRSEIEAAYLALYDNGRSVRVLPVGAASVFGDASASSLGVQPWGTLQMVLYGGNYFIRRFFDENYHLDPAEQTTGIKGTAELLEEIRKLRDQTNQSVVPLVVPEADEKQAEKAKPAAENVANNDAAKNGTADGKKPEAVSSLGVQETPPPIAFSEDQLLERELFPINEPYIFLQSRSSAEQPASGDLIGQIRSSFVNLTGSYTTGIRSLNEMASSFLESLRNASVRAESLREKYIDDNHAEFAAKTQYPQRSALTTEFRYQRLAPFFWMWVFAAGAIVFAGFSLLSGSVRFEMLSEVFSQQGELKKALQAAGKSTNSAMTLEETEMTELVSTNSAEEIFFWIGTALLGLSIFVTFIGGLMRAWITGWAPVTNMYETIVLMALSASLFGIWYALYPLIHPVIQLAWRYSSFPKIANIAKLLGGKKTQPVAAENPDDRDAAMRQAAADFGVPGAMSMGAAAGGQAQPEDAEEQRKNRLVKTELFWQSLLFIPRLILMLVTFLVAVNLSYGEYAHEHGVFAAAVEMLKMSDFIDWLVVVACLGVLVWYVPQLILTALLIPVIFIQPSLVAAELGIVSQVEKTTVQPRRREGSEMSAVFQGETGALGDGGAVDNSGSVWFTMARKQILNRTLFIIVAASVALLAGLASYYNTAEFNPDIKPIVAVLRSNFWLTVHVIAIVVSYAAALVAWGMAVVGLGNAIFGRYRYTEIPSNSSNSPEKRSRVQMPIIYDMFAPIIQRLLQSALVLLIIGTVLGARWADYSWGRFWSWDPKEVWALITILFYVIVLHGRIARFYHRIGIMVGALFASIAVIITWYGINFVFKGSIHSYGGGAVSSATLFLAVFIIANILWGSLAIFRYTAEVYGRETEM